MRRKQEEIEKEKKKRKEEVGEKEEGRMVLSPT